MGTPCTRNSGIVKPLSTELAAIATLNTNYDVIDASLAKGKWDATTDPAVTDDSGDGYAVGSLWVNTTGHKIFIAEAVTVGAALWRQIFPIVGPGADIDFGSYEVRAQTFESDQATGTAPMVVASTTKVTNLNADQLDGCHDTTFPKKADLTTKGDIWAASAASTPARLGVGANGLSLIADSAQTQGFSWAELMTEGVYRQALVNGGFQVNQQAVSPYTAATTPDNGDDTYLFDQWILLSDGDDIVDVSQETSVIPLGAATSAKFEVETANKKFGILQIIENVDALKFAGKAVSLQFKARTTAGKVIENLRAAVLSWSSTANAPTSDVVSAWGAEGSNPTLATNWTAENTAANLALVADTWTTYKIENIAVDTASMANLAVFIWVDDTDASIDDLLYIADVQLNQGPVCLPYMPLSFAEEIEKCYRFWESSYAYGTVPGTASTAMGLVLYVAVAPGNAKCVGRGFKRLKMTGATTTIYSYQGSSGKVTNMAGSEIGTSVVPESSDRDAVSTILDSANPFDVGAFYQCHWKAEARL